MYLTPNLAAYYVLPMIDLSYTSFGDEGSIDPTTKLAKITTRSNFINCYLSTENYIVVKVRDFTKIPKQSILSHNYFTDIEVVEEDGSKVSLILYRVDRSYLDDLTKFRNGKYSRMRDIVKDKIIIFNGWDDNFHKVNNLLVGTLYRSSRMRIQLEENFDIKLSEEDEVKSLPDENNFIDLSKTYKEVAIIN